MGKTPAVILVPLSPPFRSRCWRTHGAEPPGEGGVESAAIEPNDSLLAVEDERREAAGAIAQSLQDPFERSGIDDTDGQPRAIALGSLLHPGADLGILLLQVRGKQPGGALFGVDALPEPHLIPDHLAVVAVEELGRRIGEDLQACQRCRVAVLP